MSCKKKVLHRLEFKIQNHHMKNKYLQFVYTQSLYNVVTGLAKYM